MQGSFMPTGATDSNTVGTSSAGGTFTTPEVGNVVRVFNDSAEKAFFRTGVGAQTAVAATDIPLAPYSVEVFRLPPQHTAWAAIRAAGTGVIYWTRGEGY